MSIIQFLELNPSYFLGSTFILGLIIGSFLNVVIYRYPIILKRQWQDDCCDFLCDEDPSSDELDKKRSLSQAFVSPCKKLLSQRKQKVFNLSVPRSRCPHCQHKIRFYENIPIISWLFLKGKCSKCQQKISARYPLVELLTGLLSLAVASQYGANLQTLALLIFLWSLISLSLIDFDTKLLPDDITLPIMWLGLVISFFDFSLVSTSNALIGAIAGYLSLWTVFQLFKLVTGKEGMGYGDFKLFALLGAWLGWEMLPAIIMLASLAGAIIGISLQLFLKKDRSIPIPFGPYLSIAGLLALFWGEQINLSYLQFSGLA